MSYTQLVKEEILQKEVINVIEKRYELYAVLKAKNSFKNDRIDFTVENIGIAKRVYSIIKSFTNLKIEIKYSISKRFGEHRVYGVIVRKQKGYKVFVDNFKHMDKEKINKAESKLAGYIRGIFLVAGYIKQPEKEYSMDFFLEDKNDAKKLYDNLKGINKKVGYTQKKNKYLVYLRNSEDIMDILVMTGAMKSFFEYEETIMFKDIKNKTVRSINWEVANETKIINTAEKQLTMIKEIEKKVGLESLTGVLEEVAKVRIKYPESSLTELAKIIGISKSGIRNRFRRLEKIYNELEEETN
ncbi:DNA-binding protein WhiA [Haliovirga abyssi]|uniref:Probable cell division protein WhiA n=1 Tax=Haliovirga abyssi TaxID=2996794 RepID=A0AAU9DH02_9FUSO|nr:DNA-binding protein WhiA [Haliovirga abyssi]BDU50752.1 putative sporulation transcription regulator WhiA [Haliovirga abyssi]